MSSETIQGRKVAFLTADEGVEQVELTEPWKAVEQAGGTPELLAPADALPAFCAKAVEEIAERRHEAQAASA